MNPSSSTKLTYDQRLSGDLQAILSDCGIDASTHPDHYAALVSGLSDYVKSETRRSFINGRRASGENPRPGRDKRFDINGKPSAMKAGKLRPAANSEGGR